MADFTYQGTVGGTQPQSKQFAVVSGVAASIDVGDICVVANGYAAKVADGGATAGNGLYGLATSVSTDTAAANGVVNLQFSTSGLIVRGITSTAANLVAAQLYDKVTLDVSGGGVQTVDENDAGALLIYNFPTSTPTTDGIVEIVLPWTLAS